MEIEHTPEALQRKLYFLLEQLQEMARELPPKYQMRVPIELLSGLANCLLNDTVFEIVKGLMEIQHVTEKHLFQQRLQVINKHTLEIQNMINTTPDPEQQEMQKAILLTRHREELKQTDMKLVMQLDQKVSDQQVTLEKAEVPGFYVTNKPIEVKVQMYLLDFILRLSQMDIPQRPMGQEARNFMDIEWRPILTFEILIITDLKRRLLCRCIVVCRLFCCKTKPGINKRTKRPVTKLSI